MTPICVRRGEEGGWRSVLKLSRDAIGCERSSSRCGRAFCVLCGRKVAGGDDGQTAVHPQQSHLPPWRCRMLAREGEAVPGSRRRQQPGAGVRWPVATATARPGHLGPSRRCRVCTVRAFGCGGGSEAHGRTRWWRRRRLGATAPTPAYPRRTAGATAARCAAAAAARTRARPRTPRSLHLPNRRGPSSCARRLSEQRALRAGPPQVPRACRPHVAAQRVHGARPLPAITRWPPGGTMWIVACCVRMQASTRRLVGQPNVTSCTSTLHRLAASCGCNAQS
jgi:hypothetical protein